MKDLELWRALGDAKPDPERLVPLLTEVATQPVTFRAPYWGRLEGCLASESPDLRRAALAVLGGAQGYRAWRQLVRALDDPNAAIREAAAAAFRQSASGQESR
jgi:HEAT repeat protein